LIHSVATPYDSSLLYPVHTSPGSAVPCSYTTHGGTVTTSVLIANHGVLLHGWDRRRRRDKSHPFTLSHVPNFFLLLESQQTTISSNMTSPGLVLLLSPFCPHPPPRLLTPHRVLAQITIQRSGIVSPSHSQQLCTSKRCLAHPLAPSPAGHQKVNLKHDGEIQAKRAQV
jgi:hypothetical protein